MDAIESRIQELGFTTHFLREMHMLAYAARKVEPSGRRSYKLEEPPNQARFHLIDANHLEPLRRSDSKMLAYAPFLEMLRDHGRERARLWLSENLSAVGRRSTLDWSHWA